MEGPVSPRPHSRGFSFHSDRSGGSKSKAEPLVESPTEKQRKSQLWQGQTKANPNAALREAQPNERSTIEQSTLQNLRDMQHKDVNGQVIADPDRSNPTRPRFERPLDTIRSFEKAINDGYKRRSSYQRQESAEQYDQNNQYASRRSSYFGGLDAQSANRGAPGGYYNQRPESANPARQRYPRNHSDPMLYGSHQQYYQQQQPPPQQQQQQQQRGPPPPPQHGYHDYHQSHDTVLTGGSGSDSTGPWANGTDPSSENSSIDRAHQIAGKAPAVAAASNVGAEWFANTAGQPILEEQGGYLGGEHYRGGQETYNNPQHSYNGHAGQNAYNQQNAYDNRAAYGNNNPNAPRAGYNNAQGNHANGRPAPGSQRPVPPPKSNGYGGYAPQRQAQSPRSPTENKKRTSWLRRRFSKD